MHGRQAGAEPGAARPRRAAISSSGWATSAWTRTRRRSSWSSTARWRCATPGRRSRKRRTRHRTKHDHSRTRRHSGRRRLRRAEGRRAGGRHRRIEADAAAPCRAGCRRRRSRQCLALARRHAGPGGLRGGGAAASPTGPKSRCTCSCAPVSQQPDRAWWSITRRTRLRRSFASPFDEATVLTLDHAGDFRCGARWHADGHIRFTLEQEMVLSGFAGRSVRRVTRAARLRAGRRRAQGAVAFGVGRRALTRRCSAKCCRDARRLAAHRPFLLRRERLQSHGGFSAEILRAAGARRRAAGFPRAARRRIAAGLQKAVEETVLALAGEGENLCLAGGLFLNALLVSASGALRPLEERLRAAGRRQRRHGAGRGAITPGTRSTAAPSGARRRQSLFLGPSYGAEEIKQVLENCKLRFQYLLTTDEMLDTRRAQLGENKIVAWMQGRMEFGPRALGNRSILASPLDPYSTENLNVFIKHREPFRKFAASVPAELAARVFRGRPERALSGDGGPRAAGASQDLRERHSGRGHGPRARGAPRRTIRCTSGCCTKPGKRPACRCSTTPVFNLFGDPLVCTPRDAVRSFYSSGIDAMFVGNFLLEK